MKSPMGWFAAFISIFYLLGFGMLWHGVSSARRSTEAATWPTTSATITHLEVVVHSDGDGSTSEVKVQYTYSVNGVAFEGSRLAFGYGGSTGYEAHEEIFRKLEGAKAVFARYDPPNPR